MFEETNGLIKCRQYNSQQKKDKRTNNGGGGLQYITRKNKIEQHEPRAHKNTGMNSGYSRMKNNPYAKAILILK